MFLNYVEVKYRYKWRNRLGSTSSYLLFFNSKVFLYVNFSEFFNEEKYLRRAIGAYREALAVYTKEEYPTDYFFLFLSINIATIAPATIAIIIPITAAASKSVIESEESSSGL